MKPKQRGKRTAVDLLLTPWVIGGMFSFFGAVAFAELGAAMPEAGGIYVFLREAYGPLLSFLFGLGFAVQLARAEGRGHSVLPVYLRRLVVMIATGSDYCSESIRRSMRRSGISHMSATNT